MGKAILASPLFCYILLPLIASNSALLLNFTFSFDISNLTSDSLYLLFIISEKSCNATDPNILSLKYTRYVAFKNSDLQYATYSPSLPSTCYIITYILFDILFRFVFSILIILFIVLIRCRTILLLWRFRIEFSGLLIIFL